VKFQAKTILWGALLVLSVLAVVVVAIYTKAPVNRIEVTSQLVMLGDLDGDRSWSERDAEIMTAILEAPYSYSRYTRYLIDINRNGKVEAEDIRILERLYAQPDPYRAADEARTAREPFPRPRELFVYLPTFEYVQPPLFLLDGKLAQHLPTNLVEQLSNVSPRSAYEEQLLEEIRDELNRLGQIYVARQTELLPVERGYLDGKLKRCAQLVTTQDYYPLLLTLIGLAEDGETLYYARQDAFVKKVLYLRDDLRNLITSPLLKSFAKGTATHDEVYAAIESALKRHLAMELKLAELDPPRDLTDIQNYLDRIEWQKYKNSVSEDDFKQLILYGQHDRRYLRAVSQTSPRHQDPQLKNHNLPMALLFREALRIKGGDKKAAVALLDEAIRIPMGWVRSIPRELLPKSLALENFLLPGNKEDGADKSRHWNVFGGIAIYKSPEAALELALKREIQDLKKSDYAPEAMEEFIRDTIANINGIYHVHSAAAPAAK